MKAMTIAKRLIRDEIRTQGAKVSSFTHKAITHTAELLLLDLITNRHMNVSVAGRLGASARNAKLTPAQRSAIASRAGKARWHKEVVQ